MNGQPSSKHGRAEWIAILFLFGSLSTIGIAWGLPSRSIDKYLFPNGDIWTGEKIHRLARTDGKFDPARGADVDVDPLKASDGEPILLNGTDEDVAKILLRYRLYTHQPDEMITMMSLAGMRPGRLELDPKLYQYGGLFIYPVGALIKLCGMLGLIDVRSDVTFYLDNPDEFGKFYIVARLYSALWGMIGVVVVYSIARRIASDPTRNVGEGAKAECGMRNAECGEARRSTSVFVHTPHLMPHSLIAHRVGLLAALLYSVMPVVVCMSHEGKPHLPGAVLMLIAVRLAMRYLDTNAARWFWWMCVACGAAVGMVLSSWPICVLIPLVLIRAMGASPWSKLKKAMAGTALSIAVYVVSNPYVLINAFTNREVLQSNFGNSLGMYEVSRIAEGFLRVVELTAEGATWPTLIFGAIGLLVALKRATRLPLPGRERVGVRVVAADTSPHPTSPLEGRGVLEPCPVRVALPLAVVAAVFFLQFVLIGAGKPAEYGRFGIFTNTALAIGCASILMVVPKASVRSVGVVVVLGWTALGGIGYLNNFRIDASPQNSRTELARFIQTQSPAPGVILIPRDPAPYNFPPADFRSLKLYLASPLQPDQNPEFAQSFIVPSDEGRPFGIIRPDRVPTPHRTLGGSWWDTPISWANKPLEWRHTPPPVADAP